MDVLIAHNFYKHAGGEDQCVAAEIALLREYGHNVFEYYARNDSIEGRGSLGVAAQSVWNHDRYRELRNVIQRHKPQLIHVHNFFPIISPAAYYAARAEGIRVVQTLHNFRLLCPNALLFRDGRVCEDCIRKFVPWPGVAHGCYQQSRAATAAVAAMLVAHRVLRTWRNAVDLYIALNEFSRNQMIRGGLPAKKIAIKPNFVDGALQPGAGAGGYFLFVGRLSAEKGVDLLLKAWSGLEGVKLKIAGGGPLEDIVKEAAAGNPSIEWLGALSPEEVYAWIGDAAALITPSLWYENFPRVVVESFAKGTPVIAPRMGAFPEIVSDGVEGLLFEPYSADDLANTIRRAVDAPDRLQQLRGGARRAFEGRLTAESNYEQLISLYERALQ